MKSNVIIVATILVVALLASSDAGLFGKFRRPFSGGFGGYPGNGGYGNGFASGNGPIYSSAYHNVYGGFGGHRPYGGGIGYGYPVRGGYGGGYGEGYGGGYGRGHGKPYPKYGYAQ